MRRVAREADRSDRFWNGSRVDAGKGGDGECDQSGAEAGGDTNDQSCFFDHSHLPGVEQRPASCVPPCLRATCHPPYAVIDHINALHQTPTNIADQPFRPRYPPGRRVHRTNQAGVRSTDPHAPAINRLARSTGGGIV